MSKAVDRQVRKVRVFGIGTLLFLIGVVAMIFPDPMIEATWQWIPILAGWVLILVGWLA